MDTQRVGRERPLTYISRVWRLFKRVVADRGEDWRASVVFPEGGYRILAMDLEGREVFDWRVGRGARDLRSINLLNDLKD